MNTIYKLKNNYYFRKTLFPKYAHPGFLCAVLSLLIPTFSREQDYPSLRGRTSSILSLSFINPGN